jgi:hypothetical protein
VLHKLSIIDLCKSVGNDANVSVIVYGNVSIISFDKKGDRHESALISAWPIALNNRKMKFKSLDHIRVKSAYQFDLFA